MWKRIDNDFYNTLIAAHRYDYAPDYFTFPFIFLLLELMIAVPVFIYGQYPPMFIPVSALLSRLTSYPQKIYLRLLLSLYKHFFFSKTWKLVSGKEKQYKKAHTRVE